MNSRRPMLLSLAFTLAVATIVLFGARNQAGRGDDVVGVTGFEVQGRPIAIAWARDGTRLLPVAYGGIGDALRADAKAFLKDSASENAFLKAVAAFEVARTADEVRAAATSIRILLKPCAQCDADYDACVEDCQDATCITRCFGRYIVCTFNNCRG